MKKLIITFLLISNFCFAQVRHTLGVDIGHTAANMVLNPIKGFEYRPHIYFFVDSIKTFYKLSAGYSTMEVLPQINNIEKERTKGFFVEGSVGRIGRPDAEFLPYIGLFASVSSSKGSYSLPGRTFDDYSATYFNKNNFHLGLKPGFDVRVLNGKKTHLILSIYSVIMLNNAGTKELPIHYLVGQGSKVYTGGAVLSTFSLNYDLD